MSVSFVEKPSRDEFAKLVIEAADRAGIAGIKYDRRISLSGTNALARWEDVAALLGDMLQDTHMFPERFFVSEFPSDQQLETLRRMQTDSRPQPALK